MTESSADAAPDLIQRNAALATTMVQLRAIIAERWERISDLLQDLGVKEKPNLTQKILAAEATSNRIRAEIQRIMMHELPARAKTGALMTLLAETDADVMRIQDQRNKLRSENGGIVGTFFSRKKFANYYADKLDFQTRKGLAEEGLLRASDTFDPSLGTLSNYAFVWMKSYIRRAAEKDTKHARISLDREFSGTKSEDSANLLAMTEDHRAERPDAAEARRELSDVLRNIVAAMPIQWQRALELMSGLGGDYRTYTAKAAAEIMNDEGLRTPSKQARITGTKVDQWARLAKRDIAHQMAPLFSKKEGEE